MREKHIKEFKIYKAWINPNFPAVATLKLGSPQVWPLREKAGCPTQLLFNCLKFCRNHPFQVKIYSFTEFAVVTDCCFVGECIICQIMFKWILKISEYWTTPIKNGIKLFSDIIFIKKISLLNGQKFILCYIKIQMNQAIKNHYYLHIFSIIATSVSDWKYLHII